MMPAMRAAEAEGEPEGARVIAISERVLFDRHRRGDPAAFPALVTAFRAPVFGYLTRCGVSPSDRDDLFQEVFLRVHRAGLPAQRLPVQGLPGQPEAEQAGPTGPFAPWLFTIAVNVVRSHFRKASVRGVFVLREDAAESTASPDRGPEAAAEVRQDVSWVEGALARLPLEQREALVLCAVEGLELADAAVALGVPVDTVKTRVRRARLALAEAKARLSLREEREAGR